MTEVHRYKVVKMLSEDGNRISYDPHGPEVVVASAFDQIKAENTAALREATDLAMAIWRRCYAKDSPNFQPFEKASSVIGQIDNMAAGLMSDLEKLRTEVAGLKTGYEAYERVNAELKAEVEVLRNALMECANSLQGEMLQKFGGQLPEDMHPVTRREYDRDIAEVSGYRAALGQGEQSWPT